MNTTNKIFILTLTCLTTAFYSCRTIRPKAPTMVDKEIPKIVQPISNIDIPVKAELKNYFKEAETSVPNEFNGNDQRCEGLRYAYFFRRSPFNITGVGNTVNLKFVGSYGIDLTYCAKCANILGTGLRCVVPKVGASCGVGGEAPRRLEISYKSSFSALQPNYHLKSRTILDPRPNPLDRCNVTILNIDATDRLIGYIEGPLNNLGSKVDEKVGGVDLKPQAQKLWDNISKEIKFGNFGYLSIHPQNLRASGFNFTDQSILNFSFGLSAQPVITTESNPTTPSQLPDLTEYQPANGFDIYLDLFASYDTLSNYISKQAVGQSIKIGRKKFVITNVKVSGIGNQKIVLAIDFKGCRKGTIYLVGTPNYNSITHEVTFPDLAFDIKTKNLLLKLAKWIFNDKITTALKDKAKYNFTKILDDSKVKLQTELNRNISDNIKTEGTVNDLNIEEIYPTKEKLMLRALSKGQLSIIMTE